MPNHQCKKEDLVRNPIPVEHPEDGYPCSENIAFILRCRICGKEFQEVFTRQEGLWDTAKMCYVFLK